MNKPTVAPVNIHRFEKNCFETTVDLLAVEEPMEIRLEYGNAENRQQQSISVTMRTPGNDFELALGFLFTEGIIQSFDEVKTIRYCTAFNTKENEYNVVRVVLKDTVTVDLERLKRNFYTTSSCGVCGKESIASVRTVCKIPAVRPDFFATTHTITALPALLRAQQNVFEHTGGLHACAVFDGNGNIFMLREDVGRHNALDKLIGGVLSNNRHIDLERSILLLSGRASFELIQKAAMAGIPIVCAVGAPSSLAVDLANNFGITLIGFLREQRFNIYTNPHRIIH